MTPRIPALVLATALTAGLVASPAIAGAARLSAKGDGAASIDLNWIGALKSAVTLDCDTRVAGETRVMMRALERQGARGRYERRDGAERLIAVRQGARFTLEGRAEDGSFKVGMPWPVAQCLFGGPGGPRKVDLASLRQEGAFSFQWKGETAGIKADISFD